MNCVLPVCHSSFSLLYGTATPEQLVDRAVQLGFEAIALADRNNLYGAYDFYYAALERGIRPIIGVRLDISIGRLTLLCTNHDWFKNLLRLVTHFQLNGRPDLDILQKYSRDLIALSQPGNDPMITKEIFAENAYISVDLIRPTAALRESARAGIKPAATPSVSFLTPEDRPRHRLLRAIGGSYLIDNIPPAQLAGENEFLQRPSDYDKTYVAFPAAGHGAAEIIEKCHLALPERKNILPDVKIDGDHCARLRCDALSGLRKKIGDIAGRYLARLEYELTVIERTGFVDYFLIVTQIIEFCKKEKITVVGRGSAAGSLVSFALDITRVDPIKHDLYFERFLNEARTDCPDIDLDVDWRYRDRVLDFIYDRYGRDHVAMMASYVRFQPKLAVRETAKAMGCSPDEVDRFTRRLSYGPLAQPDHGMSDVKRLTRSRHEWERFQKVLAAARSIADLPRHLSIHSGGIVITPKPITEYVALEQATKGIVVTQCDMYQAEKIGLVKIDVLGQRGLAVIADCLEQARKIQGDNFEVPEDDPATFKTFRSGKTIGAFQIESPGLRALLRDLQPRQLDDITLALALIRPGASESGMKKLFLNRFHGKDITEYPHPNLEKTLAETFGVFIYQEQVILAAQRIAGFNLPACDMLRRAIAKKRKAGSADRLRERFLDGAKNNGVEEHTAENILAQLQQFAAFGFCKAHAATYGHLSYISAYFKTHYPAYFMTAVLRNGGGYYPSAVYVAEARRLGVEVHPPDVHRSDTLDTVRNNKLYLGLCRVRDITYKTLEQIEKYRPFDSLADFLSKITLSEREAENLIRVGFFDSIEPSRPKLLWQYRLWGRTPKNKGDDLFGGRVMVPQRQDLPPLQEFSRLDIFNAERGLLEIPASFNPLSLFKDYRDFDPRSLKNMTHDSPLTVSGWLADRKRIKTRDGKQMVFLTFDALDDTFEVVLFPDTWGQYGETVRSYRYLTIEGRVNLQEGSPAIVAEKIYPAETGLKKAKFI